MAKKITYKSSGVDISKANEFVDAIKTVIKKIPTKGVINRAGSFGALFDLDLKGIKQPILVSSTDGVGTKLLVANQVGMHDTVGIDLVAMNTNDILCTGAKPLFFLDYIACGQLKPKLLKEVMKGVAEGCAQSQCALIGGETAEMPGMYAKEDYDLAGFAVGVVDKSKIIDGSKIKAGDIVLGLESSGFHSNGYSLVRKAFSKAELKKYANQIMAPTKIYVDAVLPLLKKFQIRGMAHITGGAYYEKLTKVLPKGLCFQIDKGSWTMPEIFHILMNKAKIKESELYRTFNMGIGFALVVKPVDVRKIQAALLKNKTKSFVIGKVIKNSKAKVVFT